MINRARVENSTASVAVGKQKVGVSDRASPAVPRAKASGYDHTSPAEQALRSLHVELLTHSTKSFLYVFRNRNRGLNLHRSTSSPARLAHDACSLLCVVANSTWTNMNCDLFLFWKKCAPRELGTPRWEPHELSWANLEKKIGISADCETTSPSCISQLSDAFSFWRLNSTWIFRFCRKTQRRLKVWLFYSREKNVHLSSPLKNARRYDQCVSGCRQKH